jgi:pyridoxine kinase
VNILSIQSWVASGHVGNAASVFPLQRLGAEVMAVNTVQFSNHPGHGAHTGRMSPPEEIADLVAGLDAHGALSRCDGVVSGYIGEAGVGHVILDAVARVRAHNERALWCCDPVIGDDGRVYVRPGVAAFFDAMAVPAADILTPNQFELDLLAGASSHTLAQARAAAVSLRDRMRAAGPRLVLVSSMHCRETPPGMLDMMLLCEAGSFVLRTTQLPAHFSGAGDLLAALFLFHVLDLGDAVRAAERAAASVAGILRRTLQCGGTELEIIAAQQEIVAPTEEVDAVLF